MLKKNDWEKQLKLLPVPDETVEIYTVFSKASAQDVLPAYEKALKTLQSKQPYSVE